MADEVDDEIEELWTQDDCEVSVEMYEAKTARIAAWLLFFGFMSLFGSCVSCQYLESTNAPTCEEKSDGIQRVFDASTGDPGSP